MCCTNWAPGVISSASACASGRPCPIVKVGATFPTCMSSVLVLIWCSKVASKSMPESTDPRLNFRQRLTRRRQRLRQDCAAIWSEHDDQDAPGCACVALLAGHWGCKRCWPEPRKTSRGLQVTRNGTIYRLILVGTSHRRAPAFRPDQRKACRATSQTHTQHIQTMLSHSWIEELQVTPWPLTCATARMSIAT